MFALEILRQMQFASRKIGVFGGKRCIIIEYQFGTFKGVSEHEIVNIVLIAYELMFLNQNVKFYQTLITEF